MITREQILEKAVSVGLDFQEWQIDYILDRTTKKWCICAGRKSGKTVASEWRIALSLMEDNIIGTGLNGGILILSKGNNQAKLILIGVKNVLELFGWEFSLERIDRSNKNKIAFSTSQEIMMPDPGNDPTKPGNRLFALPCGQTADNLRPFSFASVIFDEADFLPENIYISTAACLARYNGVEVLQSTPNVLGRRDTYFGKAYFGDNPDYKIIHTPTSAAPHITQEWLDRQRAILSAGEYEREYEAKFASGASAIYPEPMIDACTTEEWDAADPDVIYLGVSFARFGDDQSVITENWFKDGVSHIRAKLVVGKDSRIMHVEEELKRMVEEDQRINKITVDDRTLGTGPMQALTEHFGETMVLGVSNHQILRDIEGGRSRYMREDLHINLLRLMERNMVSFYDPDGEIKRSLMDMKYDYYKRSGMVKIFSVNDAVAEAVVRALFPVWGRNEFIGKIPDKFIFIPQKF